MSLVLKSNNVATASLGNINGLPSQDYALFLDFENNEYIKKVGGEKFKLSESSVLTSTSNKNLASNPMTMDRFGNKSVVTAQDQLRFWGANGRYGLLVEAEQNNWFLNSAAPVSQTIPNIPASSTLVASCIGSGSITISGAGIDTITVTESTPKTITPIGQAVSITLDVAVNGSLSHVQVVRVVGIPTLHTPITSGGTIRPSGSDNIEVNQSLLSEIIASGAVTVLCQTVGLNYTLSTSAINESRLIIDTDAHIAAISLNKKIDSVGMRLASYATDGTPQITPVVVNSKTYENGQAITQVVQLSATGFKGATNGGSLLTSSGAIGLQSIKKLLLASNIAAPVVVTGGNCIFTKLAIFNKALTDAEILEYSKSWN